ncbi:hypothetical protein H8E88_10255 [candidate division KSB1 bacterium]|nr:hypothetical protein [candidate division KSB1 bacterium]
MDIEKNLSEIRQALKEDTGEGTKNLLSQIGSEVLTMQDALKRLNSENKTKRESFNELQISTDDLIGKKDLEIGKLKKSIETLSDDGAIKTLQADHKTETNELKTDYDTKITDLTTQNEQLQDAQKQLYGIFKTELINDINTIVEHPDFEKVKDILKLPEIKDEKYDFDSWTDDDIIYNKSKLNEYRKVGLFEEKIPISNTNIPMTDKIDLNIDIVELAKRDPEAAKKELAKRRKTRNSLV